MEGYATSGDGDTFGVDSWYVAYKDFKPMPLESRSMWKEPKYERFDVLVRRANEWLLQHPEVRVKTCESLEVAERDKGKSEIDTDKSTSFESGKQICFYVRCLRLWFTPNDQAQKSSTPQQIGFQDAIPMCTEPGGTFSSPKFESYGETVAKLNASLKSHPLPGHILNVETQEVKFHKVKDGIDSQENCWYESGNRAIHFLNFIRVFYEIGEPACEEIGCADFAPQCTKKKKMTNPAEYEPLSVVVDRAQTWIQENPSLNITNVQGIDYKVDKMPEGGIPDSQVSVYCQYGKGIIYYTKIVRVYYTVSLDQSREALYKGLTTLSYKIFVPALLKKGGSYSFPKFESMGLTLQRANAWFKVTGVNIISAETFIIRMYLGENSPIDSEKTHVYDISQCSEQHLYCFRFFLDGVFTEPSPESLPPLPELGKKKGDGGCCIS